MNKSIFADVKQRDDVYGLKNKSITSKLQKSWSRLILHVKQWQLGAQGEAMQLQLYRTRLGARHMKAADRKNR